MNPNIFRRWKKYNCFNCIAKNIDMTTIPYNFNILIGESQDDAAVVINLTVHFEGVK